MIASGEQSRSEGRPALAETVKRIEDLGRIILAYSEVTERLQRSHDQLNETVESLRRELSEKNRLLERKNRLAALGEMAAGLAHEIRNPLGAIQLYASMLTHDLADSPEPLRTVEKISGGVKRLEQLVGQVLQFTRDIEARPRKMDLVAVVDHAVEMAGQTLGDRGVRCSVAGPRPMPVTADPIMLEQVVLNLLLNAAEAIEEGGQVFVSFGPPRDGWEARQFFVLVRDTGPGIPGEVLDRVFNPFFTTKENGTGLGLAIVHRMIEAHDGTIVATNDPHGGARFEIRV